MSNWDKYDFENRLRNIMLNVKYEADPEHHFGRPFLSAYQLAIEYDKMFHNDVIAMGYAVGGKGIGVNTSLAQYIAGELSRRIKKELILDIEGSFFSNIDLKMIEFDGGIISSLTDSGYDLSMFRIKKSDI